MKKTSGSFDEAAKLFSALGNPLRLQILYTLIQNCGKCKSDGQGCCVNDIVSEIPVPQPYVSKHLKILKEAGILNYRREGNKILYSFNDSDILNLLRPYIGEGCC